MRDNLFNFQKTPNGLKFAQTGHPGANPTIFEFTATTPGL
jgi:hypothetical protein